MLRRALQSEEKIVVSSPHFIDGQSNPVVNNYGNSRQGPETMASNAALGIGQAVM